MKVKVTYAPLLLGRDTLPRLFFLLVASCLRLTHTHFSKSVTAVPVCFMYFSFLPRTDC